MNIRTVFVSIVLCAFAFGCWAGATAPGHAADKSKDRGELALPSMQLGDYSLKFATNEPRQPAPEPSGLSAMRQEDSPRAFVGFSLSRSLPDDFWNFAR